LSEVKICAGYFMGKGGRARNMLLLGGWAMEKAFSGVRRVASSQR
jgi:hypothetical protein